jgi:hypothetical protein
MKKNLKKSKNRKSVTMSHIGIDYQWFWCDIWCDIGCDIFAKCHTFSHFDSLTKFKLVNIII